jgi:methylated-DNA-protein-cysteine methyltransferase-like protein
MPSLKYIPSTLDFRSRVYAAVKTVPNGWVTTYGDVAAAIGSPRAARQVGYALSQLSEDACKEVPWYRVINAQGSISLRGDLTRGALQKSRLAAEGTLFGTTGRTNLGPIRWHYPTWLEGSGR